MTDAIDFSSLKALQEITIGKCSFQFATGCSFCNMQNLRSIQLSKKCFTCRKGTLSIKDCKQLSSISIDSNCCCYYILSMKSMYRNSYKV